tara:strand:+ start:1959 stop:2297 length:339 start_codon:yes stop_codon:yes gene_type:complete
MVAALVKNPMQLMEEVTPEKLNLLHMAVGVAGEAGELLDAAKKCVMYNKSLDVENVIEELGDIEFYMEGLRQHLGITREETLDANIAKLGVRYAKGFSNEAAQARADKEDGE